MDTVTFTFDLMAKHGAPLVITGVVIWAGIKIVKCLFGEDGAVPKISKAHVAFTESVQETNQSQADTAKAMLAALDAQKQGQADSHEQVCAVMGHLCDGIEAVAPKLGIIEEVKPAVTEIRRTLSREERQHARRTQARR